LPYHFPLMPTGQKLIIITKVSTFFKQIESRTYVKELCMKRIFILLFWSVTLSSLLTASPFEQDAGKKYLHVSPDGHWLLYDTDEAPGLYLLNLASNESILLADGFGIAPFAGWSADSRYVTFKMFNENLEQIPCVFDVRTSQIIRLHQPVALAGVPTMDKKGRVAFTIGNTLLLTTTDGTVLKSFDLGTYANLAPVSYDGRFVVYNDEADQLHILEVKTGNEVYVTESERGYFNPRWNPTKEMVLFQDFSGNLYIYDVQSRRQEQIAQKVTQPLWNPDGTSIVFTKNEIVTSERVLNSDLFMWKQESRELVRLTDTPQRMERYATLALNGKLFFTEFHQNKNEIFAVPFSASLRVLPEATPVVISKTERLNPSSLKTAKPTRVESGSAYSFEMPYVHQCYDSPTWFNGCTACGGTAAVMCLSYYDILPKRPRTVYSPFTHTTYYGDYIAEKYTYNGFTFDIWAYDRDGTKGYGAFGFIVRHGSEAWSDTKGFMAEYARKHGLYSYVDWSPTREKLMTEANGKRPFVLLNSITSSGHYISVIGYDRNATTVIVNDPAGDKSLGHYGANYEGKGAQYDWPGYSNGHPNLNTVWCFIYFRNEFSDIVTTAQINVDTLRLGDTFPVSIEITNRGNLKTDSTDLYFFLSLNRTFEAGSDWVVDTLRIPGVAPGDTLRIDTTCTMTDSMVSAYFYFGPYVKAESKITEANVVNNAWTKKLPLKGYPNIFRVVPRGQISDSLPAIKASFIDPFTPIDEASVRMFLDSVEVSSQTEVTATSASFKPLKKLADGLHSAMVKVKNECGLESVASWQFTVDTQTGIDFGAPLPQRLQLQANFPNPFNSETQLRFTIPKAGGVSLELFDVRGQKVATLLHKRMNAGTHTFRLNANDLASGIYFVRLRAGNEVRMRRILLIK